MSATNAALLVAVLPLFAPGAEPAAPPAPAKGALVLAVKDAAGQALAARFACLDQRGDPAAQGIVRGEGTYPLDAGAYRVIVGHGPAYTLFDEPVQIAAGAPSRRDIVLARAIDTTDFVSIDPCAAGAPPDALAREAEGLDLALPRGALGDGVAWNPRDPEGRFSALCPWSGIAADDAALAGVWAIGFDHDRAAAAWWGAPGDAGALRFDWFNLLGRGRSIALLAGSSEEGVLGLPRVYVPAARVEDAVGALRGGAPASVSWGIFVRLQVEGAPAGALVPARFGGVSLRVTVQAPPWVETDEVTIFAGGEAVMRTDLRPEAGKPLRLDRTYFLRSNRDTFYVVAASATGNMAAYLPRTTRPLGIAGPVWVDAEGDGRYTPAQDYAAAFLARYPRGSAAALDALRLEPLRVQVQAASLSDDRILLDHIVDDIAQAVRLAALGNLRRNAYAWAPDIFARRLVKNDREIVELAETTAGLVACGSPAAFETFAESFERAPYAKKDAALLVLLRHGRAVAPAAWHVVGPFGDPDRAGIRARFGPEQGAVAGQPFRDFQGNEARWEKVAPSGGALVLRAAPDADVHYALARFTVAEGGEFGFVLGSRGGVAAWIDREKIVEKEGRDAAALFVPRALERGDHQLMLKCPRNAGEARVLFGVLDPRRVVRFEGE
ncbi:MAG TPA: hypothetical protein DCM87_22435 [Planctomycetes bacterium]|nr:hypothetical protein [Planctomycetota bacterium]